MCVCVWGGGDIVPRGFWILIPGLDVTHFDSLRPPDVPLISTTLHNESLIYIVFTLCYNEMIPDPTLQNSALGKNSAFLSVSVF